MVKKLHLTENNVTIDNDIAVDKIANIISKSLFAIDDKDDIVIFIDNVVNKLPAKLYVYSDISPARWKITFTNDGRFITEPDFVSDCIITVADDHLIKESQSLLDILKQLTFWYDKIK